MFFYTLLLFLNTLSKKVIRNMIELARGYGQNDFKSREQLGT